MYYEEKDNFKEAESKLTPLKGSQVNFNAVIIKNKFLSSKLNRLLFLKMVNAMVSHIKTYMTAFTIQPCLFIKMQLYA